MEQLISLIIGLAAGIVGAISSGGGLLSIPVFLFMGVAPVTTIATTRIGSGSGGIASVYRYHKDNLVRWRYFPYLAPLSCIAGILGPRLLIRIDQQIIVRIIGGALILLFILLYFTKEYGILVKRRHRKHKIVGLILVFFAMMYATMFGAGGGALVINIIMYFFGLSVTEAIATGMSVWLAGTIVASFTYALSGVVNYSLAIPLMIGSVAGGYLGAHWAIQKDSKAIKKILAIIIGLSGIKILFF